MVTVGFMMGVGLAMWELFLGGPTNIGFVGLALVGTCGYSMERRALGKIMQVKPGMSAKQVCEILGDPTEEDQDKRLQTLRFELFQWGAGWKPVYVVLERDQVIKKYVDRAEYEREVDRTLKAWDLSQKEREMQRDNGPKSLFGG